MHIIINRIALIMYDNKRVRKLKWSATLLVGAINISVFVIWMPARLEVSETWIHINDIWDRVEKGMLAVVDLGLNLYFIYLVRKELITYGLTKYRHLYRFNIGMIFISMSLDVSKNSSMSRPDLWLMYCSRSSSLASCLCQINPCPPLCKHSILVCVTNQPGDHG